jgi:regulator of sigma E protease
MSGLIMAAQLLLALTILVGLHEWGHFIFARIFKIRVNKFYIFFDFLFPLPNVLNFSLWKKKFGETEWGLGWFPLGGYVDIAGMVDETKDASQLSATPEPWEFRAKPAWQRLFVMLGGIIVNVILGVLIFSGVKYVWGEEDLAMAELNKNGIYAHPIAEGIGLKTGDKIQAINGKSFEKFSEFRSELTEENITLSIERAGKKIDIPVPNEFIEKLASKESFIEPLFKFEVKEVAKGSVAEKAGLLAGDRIVSLNGQEVNYYQLFSPQLRANAGKEVLLGINRKGVNVPLKVTVGKDSTIGFYPKQELNFTQSKYGIGESFSKGTVAALSVIPQQIKGFSRIFKGHISAKNALSGPVGLSQMFGGSWDWFRFWSLTGLLSMALAFMNALPIPAIDGGHAVLLIFEMVTGKKPSEKNQERIQTAGTFILLALMVYVLWNDISKLF